MMEKPAQTRVPIADIIARRWSGRAFDRDKPVDREQLIALLEAARWAPSCRGEQPWRYIVWDRFADEAAWSRAFECLSEGNRPWVRNAPILLLATAYRFFEHDGSPNRWAQYDAGAASENLCLQAVALGLMAHQMGGFDAEKVRAAFQIPDEFECMAMIAVGYPAEPEILESPYRERELAGRVRRPLGELFFNGVWQKPIDAP